MPVYKGAPYEAPTMPPGANGGNVLEQTPVTIPPQSGNRPDATETKDRPAASQPSPPNPGSGQSSAFTFGSAGSPPKPPEPSEPPRPKRTVSGPEAFMRSNTSYQWGEQFGTHPRTPFPPPAPAQGGSIPQNAGGWGASSQYGAGAVPHPIPGAMTPGMWVGAGGPPPVLETYEKQQKRM